MKFIIAHTNLFHDVIPRLRFNDKTSGFLYARDQHDNNSQQVNQLGDSTQTFIGKASYKALIICHIHWSVTAITEAPAAQQAI